MNRPILIIDDDEDVREIMKFTLETEGHEVIAFSGAIAALEFLQRGEKIPALIIVDYLMPGMDGIEFIKELRTHQSWETSTVPLAISSATDTFEATAELPDDVLRLCKPMELDDLLKLVSSFTHRQHDSSFPGDEDRI